MVMDTPCSSALEPMEAQLITIGFIAQDLGTLGSLEGNLNRRRQKLFAETEEQSPSPFLTESHSLMAPRWSKEEELARKRWIRSCC